MLDGRKILAMIAHDGKQADKHPHDPDTQAIQRVCNVRDVPLAINLATANLLISAEAV